MARVNLHRCQACTDCREGPIGPAVPPRGGRRGARPYRCRRQCHCRQCRDSGGRPAASTTRSRLTVPRTDSRADTSASGRPRTAPARRYRTGSAIRRRTAPARRCRTGPGPREGACVLPRRTCGPRRRPGYARPHRGSASRRPRAARCRHPRAATAEALRSAGEAGWPLRGTAPPRLPRGAAVPPPEGERGIANPAGVCSRHPSIRSDARVAGRERAARSGAEAVAVNRDAIARASASRTGAEASPSTRARDRRGLPS